MSDATLRQRADRRYAEALAERGGRDPRDFYRERLRELKDRDPAAYRTAKEYYETRLLQAVAAADTDPLAEWLEYGRLLAELTAPGRTVQVDASGRASDFAPPVPADHLVLHLPRDTRAAALVVGIPNRLSAAQRATYELLVSRALE